MPLRTGGTVAVCAALALLALLPAAGPSGPIPSQSSSPDPILLSGTPVPGLIVGDVTWDVAGSPYLITKDVTVDANASLTIMAGVEVRFEGVWTLTSDGTTRVQGAPGNPVSFRQNRTDAQAQFIIRAWNRGSLSLVRAVLDDGAVLANGTVRLAVDGLDVRCGVSACGNPLHLQGVSDVALRDVTVEYASTPPGTWGLEGHDTKRLLLDDFSIRGTYGGISVHGCDACRISNGTLSGLSPTTYGLYLQGNDSSILNLHFPSGSSTQIQADGNRNGVYGNRLEFARDTAVSVGGDGIVVEGNVIRDSGGSGIYVYRTTDALIRNNQVSGARTRGIIVTHGAQPAYGSTVVGNYVEGSGWGIMSEQTQGLIRGNTLRGNGVGVELRLGSNEVDHNHFEFNTVQARDTVPGNAWDDGYPSGGNWWSDYAGDDLYSGPGQDIPGSDGIGDAPQPVPTFGVDRYPFYSAPAPGVPQEFTANAQVGGIVRLTWRPAPMADSYYLYTASAPTGFNFGAPIRLPNVTEWVDFAATTPGPHYYVLRAHNTTVDRTGATSNTAGAWTKAFPAGRSTLSLPFVRYPWVEYTHPGWVDTVGEFAAATGATSFAYMEAGRWRYVPGDGDPNRPLILGEGYFGDFSGPTSMTFAGLPGAMIDYAAWPPYPIAGFDPASTARQIAAAVVGDDVVVTWVQIAEVPPGNGTYEVCASRTPAGLRGYPGAGCPLLATVPATTGATLSYTHVSALAASSSWYYQVVPFRAAYLKGASTYSVGVVATTLAPGYSAIGLPLQPFENGTYVARNVSSLSGPGSAGVVWFDPARGDWVAHASWMAAGTYDAPFTMVMAVQVDVAAPTRIVFVGV